MKPRASLLFYVVSVISLTLYGHDAQFQFDQLYPKNVYTKAIEQCVYIWGAWDQLLAKKASADAYTKVIDRSIGQLVLAKHFLTSSSCQKESVSDQMLYLSRVIGTVDDRFQRLPHLDADRKACLKEWITALKKVVQQKLDAQ